MNILRLYRAMLYEGNKFENYNFRVYTTEKIKKTFRQHKDEVNTDKIDMFIKLAEKNLALIKRQTTIGNLYIDTKVVLDKRSISTDP